MQKVPEVQTTATVKNARNEAQPCEHLEGKKLVGQIRGGSWTVTKKLGKDPKSTGGTFSIGYLARHDDGTEAFVKATDIGLLNQNSSMSPLDKMTAALQEQKFERAILDVCSGNNMDRVVHALDYGEFETTETGVREYVFFIVFELAKGDLRGIATREISEAFSWKCRAMHNLATAISQLHAQKIAHNDVKPSNLLVFDELLQKLSDMGRATSDQRIGPWDQYPLVGDRTYSAPELWYRNAEIPQQGGKVLFTARQASDLYLLGSMGFFLVTGEKLTPALRLYLRPEHWPENWTGAYVDVQPYVRESRGLVMAEFDQLLPTERDGELTDEAKELRTCVMELTDPDPNHRGHPLDLKSGIRTFSLSRYISTFDRIARRAKIREAK